MQSERRCIIRGGAYTQVGVNGVQAAGCGVMWVMLTQIPASATLIAMVLTIRAGGGRLSARAGR